MTEIPRYWPAPRSVRTVYRGEAAIYTLRLQFTKGRRGETFAVTFFPAFYDAAQPVQRAESALLLDALHAFLEDTPA